MRLPMDVYVQIRAGVAGIFVQSLPKRVGLAWEPGPR